MKLRAFAVFAFLALPGLFAAGCPSSDNATPDASDDGPEEALDLCDLSSFLEAGGNGGQCSPVSPTKCFSQCNNDGCQCKLGPNGTGVWSCTTDRSCLVDCGPLSDCGATGDDGGDDSGEAGDAMTPDATEAGADATDGGDGGLSDGPIDAVDATD